MSHPADVSSLRRYILLGQLGSMLVVLFGVASIFLFAAPWKLGVPVLQINLYQGHWAWLLAGLVFVTFGIYCSIIAGRWARRLMWIYRHVSPEPMRVSIEIDRASDSTSYYAMLRPNVPNPEAARRWKVAVYNPSWNVELLKDEEVRAKVYSDPNSGKPAVIETDFGLLWRMAGDASAELRRRQT
jgi:hypothetical protein